MTRLGSVGGGEAAAVYDAASAGFSGTSLTTMASGCTPSGARQTEPVTCVQLAAGITGEVSMMTSPSPYAPKVIGLPGWPPMPLIRFSGCRYRPARISTVSPGCSTA